MCIGIVDESSGLPPIVQVSSKVFPGRPPNALIIICDNPTIAILELPQKSPCPKSIYPSKVHVVCVCVCVWCICHYQVGIMQYLEHNLAKCATIV